MHCRVVQCSAVQCSAVQCLFLVEVVVEGEAGLPLRVPRVGQALSPANLLPVTSHSALHTTALHSAQHTAQWGNIGTSD